MAHIMNSYMESNNDCTHKSRRAMPAVMNVLVIVSHCIAFGVNGGTLVYDVLHIDMGTGLGYRCLLTYKGYAGKFKHLTFWCQILQTVYFGYCLLNDIFGSNLEPHHDPQKRSKLQKFRDFFYASVIFPIGVFVVMTFWGIYAVDRELVFPKVLDGVIPAWLNHVMHTTVLPFLLVEQFLVYHHYPSRKSGLSAAVGFTLLYQIWILWIAFYADLWVYPILQVLSWPGRLLFFSVLWVFMITIYIAGEKMSNAIWNKKALTALPYSEPHGVAHVQKIK